MLKLYISNSTLILHLYMQTQWSHRCSALNCQLVFYYLLLAYADVLASSISDLGETDRYQHRINTGDSPPLRQPVRRIAPYRRKEVKELLNQMLKRGVIETSSSPWSSPVVLVQKKDGSTIFYLDYRKLNQMTRKDAYPLPRIDLTLDTLHGCLLHSTF